MNERDWQRLERRLIDAHAAADPPLSRRIWSGVQAAIAVRPARRSIGVFLGAMVVAAAAVVALWFLPGERERGRDSRVDPSEAAQPAAVGQRAAAEWSASTQAAEIPAAPGEIAPSERPAAVAAASNQPVVETASLNAHVATKRAVTFVLSADAGRIEVEPCKGRFVNVTVLDSPHRALELVVRERRVEARLDGGAVMRAGVAHVLVPADTHLIISTRSGSVVVRGLGGPMEVDTRSGEVRVDSAPRVDPSVTITSDGGAIAWQGRCGHGCRVDARSRTGDVTLRAPDRSAFTRGAARGESREGRVHLEELTCTDARCSSPPLPWRQVAPGNGH